MGESGWRSGRESNSSSKRPRLTERGLARRLEELFQSGAERVRLGIGDDAALLAGSFDDWVCSVDASVEGVHFERRWLSAEDLGYRAFQAAVSDLAAMGAAPVAALSALILPRALSVADIEQLAGGQALASRECACPVVGGNIARGGELSVTTTVIGHCQEALRRDGARPGEELWLIGSVGLAAAGLAWLRLERGVNADAQDGRARGVATCVSAWRRPRAQLARGRELVGRASSCIDVSDGLAADAQQLARASAVRLVIDEQRLRSALEAPLLQAARALGKSPLRFALHGGEDYALLATGSARRRPTGARVIGYVTRGTGAVLQRQGRLTVLTGGYDHLVAS